MPRPFDDGGMRLQKYFHDGSWGGFENSYYHSLAADRTIVVLSNHSGHSFGRAIFLP